MHFSEEPETSHWIEANDHRRFRQVLDDGSDLPLFERPSFMNLIKGFERSDIIVIVDIHSLSKRFRDTAQLFVHVNDVRGSVMFLKQKLDTSLISKRCDLMHTFLRELREVNIKRIEYSGRAYGYVRTSTMMQAQDGSSLTDQEMRIRDYAMLNDLKISRVFADPYSSGTTMNNRKAFNQLLALIEPGDVIIALDTSRVSRNVYDTAKLLEELTKKSVSLQLITTGLRSDDSFGWSRIQLEAVTYETEAAHHSERVSQTMATMSANGYNVTRPVYGWKKATPEKGSGLVEVPEQQVIIARIKQMHFDGKLTPHAIGVTLTKEGIPTPSGKGKSWSSEVVYNVIWRGTVNIKGRKDK